MQNFTYRSTQEKDNIEAVLKQRKRKFNTQQWVARIILIAIIGSLLLYVANRVYYTEFDGYVSVDANKVRTPFDIYLDSVYVKTGDILAPGDTMYSYYIIDVLVENSNPNKEPAIIASNRDIKIRYQSASRDISVLKVQIEELKKQIEKEDHNISFGLSSNSHKMDLERQLSEATTKLRSLMSELYMLAKMKTETTPDPDFMNSADGHGRYGQQIYDDYSAEVFRAAVNYHLSSDSSIVTDVVAPNRMIFFEKEDILTTQHIDLEGNNLSIMAYVPVEKMKNITDSTKAEIIINDKFTFTATVSALGLRTAVIPENLRSYFAKKNTALIAMFKIDKGQTVPFWCMADGLPVQVRIKNLDTWKSEALKRNRLWYTTGKGLIFGHMDTLMQAIQTLPAPSAQIEEISSAKKEASIPAVADTLENALPEAELQNTADAKEEPAAAIEEASPKAAESLKETSLQKNVTARQTDSKPAGELKPMVQYAPDCRYYVIAGSFAEYDAALGEVAKYLQKYPQAGILKSGNSWKVYIAKADIRDMIVKRSEVISEDIGRISIYDTKTGKNIDY